MTASQPEHWAEGLLAILEQQDALYRQLESLSQRQGQCVRSGQTEPLLEVLSHRQKLIDHLDRASKQLEPYRRQWPQMWGLLQAERRRLIEDRIRQVQQILQRIMARDEQDRRLLDEQRQQTRRSLQQLNRGLAMHRAYRQPSIGQVANRYTDAQG